MVEFIGWVLRGEQKHIKKLHSNCVSFIENGDIDSAKAHLSQLHEEVYGADNKRKIITANSWAHRNPQKSLDILSNMKI